MFVFALKLNINYGGHKTNQCGCPQKQPLIRKTIRLGRQNNRLHNNLQQPYTMLSKQGNEITSDKNRIKRITS